MSFYFPWIALTALCPLAGAAWVRCYSDPDRARRRSLVCCGLTLIFSLWAGVMFARCQVPELHDPWEVLMPAGVGPLFAIDVVNAPLLPLSALLYLLMTLATLRTKLRQFSLPRMLVSESILLATLSTRNSWMLIGLLALGILPTWDELRVRRKPTRVFLIHMLLFVALLTGGQILVNQGALSSPPSAVGVTLLMVAVLIRNGCIPLHCWITDLFDHATYGTSLLFVTPMVGAYAAVRLVLPVASNWALHAIAILSLITALYAAGMALVQTDARRFFCYLFLSHSSLVLVGLKTATPLGLTGGLCVWLSVCLSLTGFGLTLRCVESRLGPLSLKTYYGLYEHIPRLGTLFLVTGLASIGFPGTLGFVGAELLIEGAMQVHPLIVITVVVVAALNGLAVLHAYFRVFTGTRHPATVDIRSRPAERLSVLILVVLILGGGLLPQLGVTSRYQAATRLLEQRSKRIGHIKEKVMYSLNSNSEISSKFAVVKSRQRD